MKHFKEFEEKAYSFINDGDNFIIFNDGKAIRCNINEDEVELEVDNYIDSFDVCKKKRTDVEEEILSKAYFNNYVHIKKASAKTQELNEYLTNPDESIEEKLKKNNKKSDEEKKFF